MKKCSVTLLILTFFISLIIPEASAQNKPKQNVTYDINGSTVTLQWDEKLTEDYKIDIREWNYYEGFLDIYYRLVEPDPLEAKQPFDQITKSKQQLPVEYKQGDTIRIFNEDVVFESLGYYEDVPHNKTWTFTFSDQINPDTIAPNTLFVLDSIGNKVDSLIINDNEQTVTILPPPSRYLESETYSIYFTAMLKSVYNAPLVNGYKLSFTINGEESHDTYDELANGLSHKGKIRKSVNNELTGNNSFDIISINENQDQFNSPIELENPFIYTPMSFYTKIKEIMIKMYTPPVYY
ncbi:Ig-like domain-containing protein [Alkalihalobacterium elongatum]|uniref:Ig-like domain-containing protein n=1 Tax=Alkalihalobacterium elongatum TaxID=2675466 RepID=UPI001C1FB65F|nr:Ig-like domain-containing protein [Alkalihalobacterium elongatum]